MYHFFKKHHHVSNIRILSTHVVRCFKGRCLISSEDEHIAIWLNKNEVAYQGEYIEFSIDHDKKYFVSELYRMLAEEDYHHEDNETKGLHLVSHFQNKKAHQVNASSQPILH